MDGDTAALQARIAALSGQINKHKQHQSPTWAQSYSAPHYPSHSNRGTARWAPYSRGARATYSTAHKNRTLVLANSQSTNEASAPGNGLQESKAVRGANPTSSREAFVTTRAKGMNQLMTKDTYAREQKQKREYQERHQQDNIGPKTSRPKRTQSTTSSPIAARPISRQFRELMIEGIRFQVKDDGSKLIRVMSGDVSKETPKKVKVADIDFLRTKHGNLVKASTLQKTSRYRTVPVTPNDHGIIQSDNYSSSNRHKKAQCENFTKYGNCTFGPTCRFAHDPKKIAICKDFLRSGTCSLGKECDLSHDPTYHRVPACNHFIRGNCTNDACRYPHVHVSPSARVCRPFANLGYCAKGPNCDKRHVFECPDYTDRGFCANREKGTCPLPHIDRASTLRKADQRQAKAHGENDSDASSSEEEEEEADMQEMEEEDDSDGVDSDIDILMGDVDQSHALSQQQDFISFS